MQVIYNPLNLPLGYDGKPIPYWLYKLHGLGIEYKCEICGNYSYWGRRAFDRHFQVRTRPRVSRLDLTGPGNRRRPTRCLFVLVVIHPDHDEDDNDEQGGEDEDIPVMPFEHVPVDRQDCGSLLLGFGGIPC
jgi:hypothetical protein